MNNINDSNFSEAFAIAWSENQGNYSATLAKKVLNFIKLQNLKVKTVLDVCCGSANFLEYMKDNGLECTGTEFLDSYIEYDKNKFKDINFVKTEGIDDLENLGTYDLISCNHDVVNMLPTIESWGTFFKNVYKHLNNGGIFLFDFYTKRKLQEWNETVFDSNDKLDYIKNIVSDGQSTTSISNIYYINIVSKEKDTSTFAMDREYGMNNYDNKFKKTENTSVEYYFENQDILNQLKAAGYRYLITTDGSLSPISNIEDVNRLHIIAIKREQ